jgi:ABC-type phosphate/phosphonate transport system substrate-binding protein
MSATGERAARLAGAFDGNLDFPFVDPAWAAFANSAHCGITSYTDLDVLTSALSQRLFDFSYLPSANCYFLQSAPYRGIVSALTPITKRESQSSLFVVAKSNPAMHWSELRGKRLGYINTYCTTSFFAPSILLARDGIVMTSFFHAFPVAPWQGQIDAVLADVIDATMVYEDVWLAKPANAVNTKVLARIDALPTPPVIVSTSLDAGLSDRLKTALLHMTSVVAADACYAGFTGYQDGLMQRFFADMAALPGAAHAA